MGGRGATSSLARLNKYGSEFQQVKTNKNGRKLHTKDKRILFIESKSKQNKTPYESMMPHRIYAVISNKTKELTSITFTDKMGFAYKFIDLHSTHEGVGYGDLGHVHVGYNREKTRKLSKHERRIVRELLIENGESIKPKTKYRKTRKRRKNNA